MDLNKFTIKSQEALQEAQTKAINFAATRRLTENTFCWP